MEQVQSVLLPLRLHQSGHSLKHLQARSDDTQYLYTLWIFWTCSVYVYFLIYVLF